jgi:hypothetical protein
VHGIDNVEGVGACSMGVIAGLGVYGRVVFIIEREIGIRLRCGVVYCPCECNNVISSSEKGVSNLH